MIRCFKRYPTFFSPFLTFDDNTCTRGFNSYYKEKKKDTNINSFLLAQWFFITIIVKVLSSEYVWLEAVKKLMKSKDDEQ